MHFWTRPCDEILEAYITYFIIIMKNTIIGHSIYIFQQLLLNKWLQAILDGSNIMSFLSWHNNIYIYLHPLVWLNGISRTSTQWQHFLTYRTDIENQAMLQHTILAWDEVYIRKYGCTKMHLSQEPSVHTRICTSMFVHAFRYSPRCRLRPHQLKQSQYSNKEILHLTNKQGPELTIILTIVHQYKLQ